MNDQPSADDPVLIVLRCRSSDTLALESALTSLNIESYTPRIRIKMRLPRTQRIGVITKPMLPSFVFAREGSLDHMHTQGIPRFTQMRISGEPIYLHSSDLDLVREAEHIASLHKTKRPKKMVIPIGSIINVPSGPFKNRMAKVLGFEHGFYEVQIQNSSLTIKLSAFLFGVVGA